MTDVVRSFIPHDTMLFTYRELAGFYDVDGSFFSPRKRAATPCYYETLGMIQKSFGGPVTKQNISDRTKSERNRYMSTIHAMEERVLKPSIENYLVLKADPICFDRINKEYVRGVFCAVGCLKTFGLTLQHEFIEHVKAFVDKDIGVALGKINGKDRCGSPWYEDVFGLDDHRVAETLPRGKSQENRCVLHVPGDQKSCWDEA